MTSHPSPLSASEILDEQFLSVRSKLLDLAATLDRLDRAVEGENGSSIGHDARVEKIHAGLERLLEVEPDRAEAIQMIFSLPHEA